MPTLLIGSAKAARLLGVSAPTVYTFHGKQLHPAKNAAGQWVYDHAEVVRFAKLYARTRPRFKRRRLTDGERCAKAMALFEAGFGVVDVVMAVEAELADVHRWHAAWKLDKAGGETPAELETQVRRVEFETKKTKLKIARETLAAKRDRADVAARRASKHALHEAHAYEPPNESGPSLSAIFDAAARGEPV